MGRAADAPRPRPGVPAGLTRSARDVRPGYIGPAAGPPECGPRVRCRPKVGARAAVAAGRNDGAGGRSSPEDRPGRGRGRRVDATCCSSCAPHHRGRRDQDDHARGEAVREHGEPARDADRRRPTIVHRAVAGGGASRAAGAAGPRRRDPAPRSRPVPRPPLRRRRPPRGGAARPRARTARARRGRARVPPLARRADRRRRRAAPDVADRAARPGGPPAAPLRRRRRDPR